MTKRARYDLYLNTRTFPCLKIAEVVLIESDGLLSKMGFRYVPDFLQHPQSFALDPVQLPLMANEYVLTCQLGIPGILDDYLPDDWGKKVLAQLAFYRDKRKLNSHSCIEMLSALSESRIGALQWVEQGRQPVFGLGSAMQKIALAEEAAQSVDDNSAYSNKILAEQIDEMSLLYLADAGTGVGGARPKALIYEGEQAYLAKFNRLTQDPYNNARVELACLNMAAEAGLQVFKGKVMGGINGREVLLLERFDLDKAGEHIFRKHLITANAMLKEPASQRDRGGVFRYDDLADLIRRYSVNVEQDLEQLLRMMLFNQGIHNTDTHERNFSFMHNGEAYQLAPAYDMVPSLAVGQYPVAGFGYDVLPPLCSEVGKKGKVFGLAKTRVASIAEEVGTALQQWSTFAETAGVSERDSEAIGQLIRI